MAKKGKKLRKAAAKHLDIKLSKKLGKSAGIISELAQNPVAREVATAALVAAASVLATRRDGTRKAEEGSAAKPGIDVAGLVSQGVTAFLAGLKQPASPPAPATAVDPAAIRPKPKLVP